MGKRKKIFKTIDENIDNESVANNIKDYISQLLKINSDLEKLRQNKNNPKTGRRNKRIEKFLK